MGPATFVPLWLLQDIVLITSGVWTVVGIVTRSRHRLAAVLEIAAFTFLYAGVYENICTILGWYQYGRSGLMFFNVPLAVALYEAIVCYAAMQLLERLRTPTWLRPIGAGFLAVVQDFALDPVATHLYANTVEGNTAHWTYRIPLDGVEIYGEPVMNFPSWMFLVGVAAAFTELGRWWFRRSGYRTWVGIVYPLAASLASLIVLFSPLSQLVLFGKLHPDFSATGLQWPGQNPVQWWILAAMLIVPPVLYAVLWRGRFAAPMRARDDRAILYALVGVPWLNVLIGILGGTWQIIWLAALSAVVMSVTVLGLYRMASRQHAVVRMSPSTALV